MRVRLRAVTLTVASAALLAASGWVASSALGAPEHAAKKQMTVFSAMHVAGAKGLVLVEGRGLVVYTFTGDKRGHAGTCTGGCAAIWPPVHGTPVVAHGVKISGKFGMIKGQVTFNGWPLYLFTGEKPKANHADSAFKVVPVKASSPKPGPQPSPPPPGPSPTWSGTPAPMPSPTYTYHY